ncbi:MAG TPA: universal stress protein [Ilumatobacteraceae bacterium]|nr:universal stress protein [Ilumatobacteraceae bacterium]
MRITGRHPVVVGVDGSANGQRAMHVAARQAARTDRPLVVVHAVGLTEMINGEHVPSHDHRTEISREVVAWCAALEGECSDVEALVLDGPPVDVLLRAATELDASLIVVGRRGAGGRPELLLGSTAHQVVEHSHCPVLVVPPDHVPHAANDEPA